MNKQEKWIQQAIKEQRLESPSSDFTSSIMLTIQQKQPAQIAPLITQTGWIFIGLLIIIIIGFATSMGAELSYQMPRMSVELAKIKISPFLTSLFAIVSALIFVQTALISKYFKKLISW